MIMPNTRESIIAPYLDAWRRKVERVGTMNFPQRAPQRRQPGAGSRDRRGRQR